MSFEPTLRQVTIIFRILSLIPLIILMTFFVIFVNSLVKKQRQEDRLIYKNWHYTVGQIIKTGSRKSGEYAKLAFIVDGMSYIEEFNFRNPIIGNCYTVYYDSLDPGKMSVLNKAEQRLLVRLDNINVNPYNVEIDKDTTPMGNHLIEYDYHYLKKEYYGNRYINHQDFLRINKDSLIVTLSPRNPSSSFISWLGEKTLACIEINNKIKIWYY